MAIRALAIRSVPGCRRRRSGAGPDPLIQCNCAGRCCGQLPAGGESWVLGHGTLSMTLTDVAVAHAGLIYPFDVKSLTTSSAVGVGDGNLPGRKPIRTAPGCGNSLPRFDPAAQVLSSAMMARCRIGKRCPDKAGWAGPVALYPRGQAVGRTSRASWPRKGQLAGRSSLVDRPQCCVVWALWTTVAADPCHGHDQVSSFGWAFGPEMPEIASGLLGVFVASRLSTFHSASKHGARAELGQTAMRRPGRGSRMAGQTGNHIAGRVQTGACTVKGRDASDNSDTSGQYTQASAGRGMRGWRQRVRHGLCGSPRASRSALTC